MISVSACFEAPEFSIIPEISVNDIKFKEVGGIAEKDSLILYLDFKDGDGDLGLSSEDPKDFQEPYNSVFHYVADGSGDTVRIGTLLVDSYVVIDTLNAPAGKLVTNRTRTQPAYSYLPVYNENSCFNYAVTQVLVREFDNLIDASYNITDTIVIDDDDIRYIQIEEALLYKPNPNHYNIEVKFFIFNNGTFEEYTGFEDQCLTYNGRFPLLSGDGTPLEGTIKYTMSNTSFVAIFTNKRIKISVRIRDRALHQSNIAYTQEFELDDIR